MEENTRIRACREKILAAIDEARLTPAVAGLLLETVQAMIQLAVCQAQPPAEP